MTVSDLKKMKCAHRNTALIERLEGVGKSQPKKSKYGNKRLEVDGVRYDSKKEMVRWFELCRYQELGEISGLRRQVVYELSVCKYIADHCFTDKDGTEITEDVKSAATRKLPVYRLKKKLMKAELGIEIKEY